MIRREGDQLVSVASFRMDDRRREYQVEVRLPAGGSWFRDVLQVDLPANWGNTATRARFIEELTWFVRTAAGPGTAGFGVADTTERRAKIRVPFEVRKRS